MNIGSHKYWCTLCMKLLRSAHEGHWNTCPAWAVARIFTEIIGPPVHQYFWNPMYANIDSTVLTYFTRIVQTCAHTRTQTSPPREKIFLPAKQLWGTRTRIMPVIPSINVCCFNVSEKCLTHSYGNSTVEWAKDVALNVSRTVLRPVETDNGLRWYIHWLRTDVQKKKQTNINERPDIVHNRKKSLAW